uniref:Uncharacterized protein n=1 Tax=Oryza meridionalis TaxID=40149 RepID=A0A0E0C2L5_9ORYZ
MRPRVRGGRAGEGQLARGGGRHAAEGRRWPGGRGATAGVQPRVGGGRSDGRGAAADNRMRAQMGGEEADGGRRSSRALLRVFNGGSAALDQATAGGEPGRGWPTAGAHAIAKPPDLVRLFLPTFTALWLHQPVYHGVACSFRRRAGACVGCGGLDMV